MNQFYEEQGATTKSYSKSTLRRSNEVIRKIGHIPSGSRSAPQLLRYTSLTYREDTPASASLALAKQSENAFEDYLEDRFLKCH